MTTELRSYFYALQVNPASLHYAVGLLEQLVARYPAAVRWIPRFAWQNAFQNDLSWQSFFDHVNAAARRAGVDMRDLPRRILDHQHDLGIEYRALQRACETALIGEPFSAGLLWRERLVDVAGNCERESDFRCWRRYESEAFDGWLHFFYEDGKCADYSEEIRRQYTEASRANFLLRCWSMRAERKARPASRQPSDYWISLSDFAKILAYDPVDQDAKQLSAAARGLKERLRHKLRTANVRSHPRYSDLLNLFELESLLRCTPESHLLGKYGIAKQLRKQSRLLS